MFIFFLIMVESYIVEKKKWWIFFNFFYLYLIGEVVLFLGLFLVGFLWIKKFIYGYFGRYMLLNVIVDIFFVYFF